MSNINVSEILKRDDVSNKKSKRKRRTSLSSLSDAYSNNSKKSSPTEELTTEVTVKSKVKDPAPLLPSEKKTEKVVIQDSLEVENNLKDPISEVDKLKLELAKLKGELASSGMGNTANEKKIVTAIKSESINQNTSEPVITRSMFMKKYNVSSRYIDTSIKSLIDLKLISRAEKDYTKKIKTFCYKLVQ